MSDLSTALAQLIAKAQFLATLLRDEEQYGTDHPERPQWEAELTASMEAVADALGERRPALRTATDSVRAAAQRARERAAEDEP